jgi:signal recognition particle receptor subunit beta
MLISPVPEVGRNMVFFNYSTMQMAAKVVYYGPGLCGKTTNLHYIYKHTAGDSRGEMVSLETETDRTLFFDLLPIDVGTIAGFSTRIQLYTVPGQVFYNTTRKLVLKGVDGVVFVADSQRAMLSANQESFRNLEENLAEMGLSSDSLPLVLQYNKRDLPDICTVDEMNRSLNRNGWLHFESSAPNGQGVFETLKGISKLTLMSLKKRLGRPGEAQAPAAGRPAPPPLPKPVVPAMVTGTHPKPASQPVSVPTPAAKPTVPSPAPPPLPRPAPVTPVAAPEPLVRPAAAAPPPHPASPAKVGSTTGTRRTVDVLSELEKIRREAAAPSRPSPPAPRPAAPASPPSPAGGVVPPFGAQRLTAAEGARRIEEPNETTPPAPVPTGAIPGAAAAPITAAAAQRNGRGELSRSIDLTLKKSDFARARRFLVSFQVEDGEHRVMDAVRDLEVDIRDAGTLERVLLRLNIALHAKE